MNYAVKAQHGIRCTTRGSSIIPSCITADVTDCAKIDLEKFSTSTPWGVVLNTLGIVSGRFECEVFAKRISPYHTWCSKASQSQPYHRPRPLRPPRHLHCGFDSFTPEDPACDVPAFPKTSVRYSFLHCGEDTSSRLLCLLVTYD